MVADGSRWRRDSLRRIIFFWQLVRAHTLLWCDDITVALPKEILFLCLHVRVTLRWLGSLGSPLAEEGRNNQTKTMRLVSSTAGHTIRHKWMAHWLCFD
ncbi:hypothetical protein HDV64DRAFT_5477 [Trichoderma sp. TUCIM 5745]